MIGETGLQFFGKISASISHDIKNVLAVINENAGLMEDLALLEAKGAPIDADRIKSLAVRIKTQIQRADGIIKAMNRFAHSVDDFTGRFDLREILELVVSLSGRFASMREVTLELELPPDPVMVTCSPFHLQNLAWLCLDFAMEASGKGNSTCLTVEKAEKEIRIRFTGSGKPAGSSTGGTLSSEPAKALLHVLQAALHVDEEKGEAMIILPDESRT
jgi:signal transduction histidine kinase